jgi:hypothetical protein
MHRLFVVFACTFLVIFGGGYSVAQDGRQIMQGIFGNMLNEMQRQQQFQQQQEYLQQQQQYQQQMLQQLQPLWSACGNGDIDSCDQASNFPLNDQTRYQLAQMRGNAVLHKAFLADWQRCFDANDIDGCRSALRYARLSDQDRQRLIGKQRAMFEEAERARIAREESIRAEQRRQEEVRRQEIARQQAEAQERRSAHKRDVLARCVNREEAACRLGFTLASDASERANFVYLLDVAQSPLGLPILKPLKTVPQSTYLAGIVAVFLAALLLYYEIMRRRAATATLDDSAQRMTASIVPQAVRSKTAPALDGQSIESSVVATPASSASNLRPIGETLRAIFGNAALFVFLYIVVMFFTYVLPWLGSNSGVLNVAGVAAGAGMYPLFWIHLGVWGLLIGFAYARGNAIGHGWLIVLPILGAVFDLTPGLNWLPFVPTIMNLVCIICGVALRPRPVAT